MYVHHIQLEKVYNPFQNYPCSVLHCVEQSIWSELRLCQAERQMKLITALLTLLALVKENQM